MATAIKERPPRYPRSVRLFQREVGPAVTRLKRDEMRDLVRLAREADEIAQHRLIETHLWLSIVLALKHRDRGILVEDLIQESNVILIELAAAGKPDDGNFTAYASGAVRRHLRRYIAHHGWVIDLPEDPRGLQPCYEPLVARGPKALVAETPSEPDEESPPSPERFRQAWALLTDRQRQILALRYGALLRLHCGIGDGADDDAPSWPAVAARLSGDRSSVRKVALTAIRVLAGFLAGDVSESEMADAARKSEAGRSGMREAWARRRAGTAPLPRRAQPLRHPLLTPEITVALRGRLETVSGVRRVVATVPAAGRIGGS